MGWWAWLGRATATIGGTTKRTGAASGPPFAPPASSQTPSTPTELRKDLLRLVLRESLSRNGIPRGWVTADLLRTSSPQGQQGLHVRLLIRHWDPRLMLHGVALQDDLLQRLLLLDPQARGWLMGFSWQFALEDASACPALPHPGAWTAPAPSLDAPSTSPADFVTAPVRIPQPKADVRADLERLLALRDGEHEDEGADGFAPTRPAQF